MYLYILTSTLYRLSCGALIIAINWLMVINNSSLSWLASTVALTFIPAMIVPLVWKKFSGELSGKKLTQFGLFSAAILSLTMFMVQNQSLLLGLNTILWLFFFIMESSWESWFASECNDLTDRDIERYSSITMSANQAALMVGPVIVAYIFEHKPKLIILTCAVIYIFCFSVAFFVNRHNVGAALNNNNNKSLSDRPQHLEITGTELALLFIWPTLAMFNFMLPAQVASFNGSMAEVGLLDALMGFGMIASGFMVANTGLSKLVNRYKLNILLLIFAALLWHFGSGLYERLLSVFILGLSFNCQRIIIRGELAKKYKPDQVGKIVSIANAFSFILISTSLLFFYNNLSVNWMIPFIYSFVIGLLMSLKFKKTNTINDGEVKESGYDY